MTFAAEADGITTTTDASALIARATSQLSYSDLSPAVVEAAKRGILDTLGVAMAATGVATEYIEPVRALSEASSVPAGTPALGYGWRLPTLDAVFWLGALAHAIDYDDYADTVHPSAPVVSAALPIAQAVRPIDGQSLIVAVAAGQDLIVRISLALRRLVGDYGWLQSVPGVLGAALASAKLLGLGEGQIRSSLGMALHQVSGTMQAMEGVGSAYRAVRDGFSARAGALVTQLAARGLSGDSDSLEGRYGLFRQFFDGEYDRDVLVRGLGVDLLGSGITFKPWPSAGHTHLFLTALEALLADPTVRPEDVQRITLTGGSELLATQCEPRAVRTAPPRSIDAKVSLPFLIGTFLRHGTIGMRDFLPEGLRDAEAIAMAERVEWRLDPSLRRVRDGFGPGVVEVTLTDGRTVRARAEHGLGHPDNPLPWERIVAKFHECLSVSAFDVPSGDAGQVVAAVADLESVADVGTLADLLTPGSRD